MAMKYLGETLDIHCGGVDLIFPHHEDEIAQSEAATGKPFSRFWCHGEFLMIDGTKMSKRLGNISTVKDLRERGVSAAALRHFVFSTHYRKQMNLSPAGLEASLEAVYRVGEFAHRLDTATGGTPELAAAAADAQARFRSALRDDLNAPEAVGVLFTFLQKANAELDRKGKDVSALEEARRAFELMDRTLDIQPRAIRILVSVDRVEPDPGVIPQLPSAVHERLEWAVARLKTRLEARRNRDFSTSDAIRAEAAEADHVVLIGGSYIASEVAASLTAVGARCTMVMLEDVAMSRAFGEDAGRYFHEVLTMRFLFSIVAVTVLFGATTTAEL